jgi:hypothetical protein
MKAGDPVAVASGDEQRVGHAVAKQSEAFAIRNSRVAVTRTVLLDTSASPLGGRKSENAELASGAERSGAERGGGVRLMNKRGPGPALRPGARPECAGCRGSLSGDHDIGMPLCTKRSGWQEAGRRVDRVTFPYRTIHRRVAIMLDRCHFRRSCLTLKIGPAD